MPQFNVSWGPDTLLFYNHTLIDPSYDIGAQLGSKSLSHRKVATANSHKTLCEIVKKNVSLKVSFGWSFESAIHLDTVMNDAILAIAHKYNDGVGNIVSDLRCNWIGFIDPVGGPKYKDLSIYSLIAFNNELIKYQEEIINFVVMHPIYKQHSLTRNGRYRFNYLKSIRTDVDALEAAYWEYIEAFRFTMNDPKVSIDIIEEDLGCHFLHHTELFFELLTLSSLKGYLHE